MSCSVACALAVGAHQIEIIFTLYTAIATGSIFLLAFASSVGRFKKAWFTSAFDIILIKNPKTGAVCVLRTELKVKARRTT